MNSETTQDTALRALATALPAGVFDTTAPARYAASMDNLRLSRLPAAVIRPRAEADIGVVLTLANTHRVPVTVRGAGSATTGTTSPVPGGWVLDLAAWTAVHVDPLARMASVQPGATVAAVDAAARAHGLMYPPDPGSAKHATIGGSIATNAGGLRGARYGVTRDYVLALEGFLPTGAKVRWGAPLRKFAAGYNLRDLWIGSEGQLGVITGATLRLLPAPAATATLLGAAADEATLIGMVEAILRSGLDPSAMEFLDRRTVECTLRFWGERDPARLRGIPAAIASKLDPDLPPALLLLELDGEAASVQRRAAALEDLLRPHLLALARAETAAGAEDLWSIRRSCSQAMFLWGDGKINEDVVVPVHAYRELFALIAATQQAIDLPMPTFGHAGDGNFHVHIMFTQADAGQRGRAGQAIAELLRGVLALGGAISGEHGIGLAKSPFVELQLGPAERAAMQAIKRALDPNNILNPDKIWTPTDVWQFPRADVHLPWDH
jgi:glycolate oxidase